MIRKYAFIFILTLLLAALTAYSAYSQDDETTRNVLKNGLLGAGTGAIASGASGGNAGTGALIGAGTGVIGGALLDMITTPSAPARQAPPPQYYNSQPYQADQGQYYEEPPQQSATSNVLKNGLLGAGTGAIAAGASGGNAGKGALIGAGTGAIGGILLDAITQPSQPRRVYVNPPPQPMPQQQRQQVYTTPATENDTSGAPGTRKKVIRKYDDAGKVVSEEEIYY